MDWKNICEECAIYYPRFQAYTARGMETGEQRCLAQIEDYTTCISSVLNLQFMFSRSWYVFICFFLSKWEMEKRVTRSSRFSISPSYRSRLFIRRCCSLNKYNIISVNVPLLAKHSSQRVEDKMYLALQKLLQNWIKNGLKKSFAATRNKFRQKTVFKVPAHKKSLPVCSFAGSVVE